MSSFTYYADLASSATTDCTPTSTGCTGSCIVPTCGSQATPCHTIQGAINLANCNIGSNAALEADVIVAGGTVASPAVYPERLFIYPNIHVIGAGRDITTVDATGQARAAVTLANGGGFGFNRLEALFSIAGFKITHGSGTRIQLHDNLGNLFFQIAGGGVLTFGEATVTDCRIENNTLANLSGQVADDWLGAGVYVAVGAPVISGNIIQRNTTTPPDLGGQNEALGWGAGVFSLNYQCRPVITRNVIRQNVTVAQQGSGGGMYIVGDAGTVLSNNQVVANSASTGGGGIYIYSKGAVAYNNLVMGNVGGGVGGGVCAVAQVDHFNLTNNTIVGNVLTVHTVPKGATFSSMGGGLFAYYALSQQSNPLVHLTNNLVAQNDATSLGGGGGLFSYRAFATNDHEDYFGDVPNEIRSPDAGYTEGSILGSNGNVSLNPTFVNAPVFWDHTNAAGTATTAVVFASTRYAVGDRIEYNDDGVSRQITTINNTSKTLTFTPALASGTTVAQRILANWGSNTDVTEDLRLTASSPLRDAGTNTPLFGSAPTTDLDDLPRPTDGDLNGSVITDIGAYEFRFADSDGDGVVDLNDCAPLVNSAWAIPDQVPDPLAISSGEILSWPRIPQSNVYNVYSGTVTSPFVYNPACLVPEVPGLSTSINVVPPPGANTAFYYLVGAVNSCGSGPIHSNATVFPPSICPTQNQDPDSDVVFSINDNCPTVSNANQADPDHDTVGTVCDNCPALYNPSQVDTNSNSTGDACEDADNDTYPLTVDCNDNDPAIHPGAAEVCNGVDDNCVNGVDEGFDQDSDTFTSCGGDCNDNDPAIHPGAAEVCNGVDDNCASGIDEGGDALCTDTNPCTNDLCGGTSGCLHPAVGDGTGCEDGSACTQADTCQAGVCTGGNPVVCTAPDACHDPGTCSPATGVCSAPPPKPDGTGCDDGSICTQVDTCQAGVCTGGNPVVCTAPDSCHDPGTCNPGTGVCSAPSPKPDGSSCDDGNSCTMGDTCQSGACQSGGLRDTDLDTHSDLLCGGDDCNDTNPLVWFPPVEVTNLMVTVATPADPSWDSQATLVGPETTYDLVSGSLSSLTGINFASSSCLQSAGPNSYSDSRPDPAAGAGFWYLARGRNSCGVGTYGTSQRDTNIPPCP